MCESEVLLSSSYVVNFMIFLIFIVVPNLLWPVCEHLFFFPHTHLLQKCVEN